MSTLCVVPCGKAKIWDRQATRGPTPAREVYTGSFAAGARRYAERFYPSWVILSAKHGFLLPDDLVPGPYEVSFLKPSTEVITVERLREQVRAKGLARHEEIVVIAGLKYAEVVSAAVASLPCRVRAPLEGIGGMGWMLQALVQASRPL